MGVEIKVLARTEEGEVKTFKANGACYRNIGKCNVYLSEVRHSIGYASPVTLTHENMANHIPATIEERHVEMFSKLWSIIPALRTCISTPAEILSSKRATFDVANYSLNEVMVAMFFMRTLVNTHAAKTRYHTRLHNTNLRAMDKLITDKGWSWEKAYLFLLCPNHDNEYAKNPSYQSEHLKGADATCLVFSKIRLKTMFEFLRGEYKGWNYNKRSYKEVLAGSSGYTQNIRSQVKSASGVEGDSMGTVFAKLCKQAMSVGKKEKTEDLFGGTISEAREGKVDYLDAWGQAYDKLVENMDAKVAVYGTLRQGMGNHRLLGSSELLGTTELKGWKMYPAGLAGGFPVIYASEAPEDEIVVEVYECTAETLKGPLDSLEGHPRWYRRQLVDTPFGEAWIYVMQDTGYQRYPQIVSGDFVEFKTGVNS